MGRGSGSAAVELFISVWLVTAWLAEGFFEPIAESKRKLFLSSHNRYREMAMRGEIIGQPTARNMPNLKWDIELEEYAHKYASKCLQQNSPVEERGHEFFQSVGENIYHAKSKNADPVEFWFFEYKSYNYDTDSCITMCNNYKQIVAENTTHVGCSYKRCDSGLTSFVCRYGIRAPKGVPYTWIAPANGPGMVLTYEWSTIICLVIAQTVLITKN